MNKFVLGSLALAASSTPCLAGSNADYAKLDRDIENLMSSLRPAATGASISGFLRSSYKSSGDVSFGGNDLGGFSIDNVRINVDGTVGNYAVHVAAEGAGNFQGIFGDVGSTGHLDTIDAFASFPITPEIRGQMGEFRAPFLASALRNEDGFLFIDNTVLGSTWSGRDQGVMVSGTFEMVSWAVAAMNGDDSAGDELAFAGRLSFCAMGTTCTQEGSYGANDQTCLTIGAGYYDDGNLSDGTAMCVDGNLTMGALSASFEFVDNGDDFGIGLPASGTTFGNTPWDASFGYMFVPDQWEGAVRYQDFDDDDDSTAITAGVNFYQAGHAAKWQFNYSTISSDNSGNEIDVIQAGLTTSI
jgi:hypothetical protein